MTNKINIIFDNSDLHIQENLTPNNIKIFFGVEDEKPTLPCDNFWTEIDGDIIDLDCSCTENWFEVDGDIVDLDLDCTIPGNECDYTWKPTNPGDSIDFGCNCAKPWDDSTNDFNIDCDKKDTTDLGRFRVDAGESVKFEIHGLEKYEASSGESLAVDLNINKTVLDLFKTDAGESLEGQLYRDREFKTEIGEGHKFLVDVKFATIANFDTKSEIGEFVDLTLNTQDTLDVLVDNNDQKLDTELKAYPSATLEFNSYDGHKLEVKNLTTSVIFKPYIDTGEDVLFELDKPYNPNIESDIDIGETVDIVINNDSVLYPFIQHGERADFELSATYSLYPNTYEMGEDAYIIMYESQNHTFNVKYDIGEKLEDFKLSTETGFVVEASDGQSLYSNIEYDPYTGFPTQVDAGEALSIELYRNRVLYPDNIEVGESVNVTLTDYPYLKLTSKVDIGESADFKLLADVRLGVFKAEIGESALITKLDELDNYEVEIGEYSEFTLATAMTLTPDTIYQGEKLYTDVKRGEPVYFSFKGATGEAAITEVKTLRSYSFAVRFTVGERLYPNDWVNEPILIDLDKRKCCDIVLGDLRNVEMDLAPYNHTTYDQTFAMCELVTFDLSSRIALSFEAGSGEHLAYNNNLNTFNFEVYEGHQLSVPNFRTTPTTELEDGNQTPENPVIDIDRPEIPSGLDYIMMGVGERASASLSASFALKNVDCTTGEHLAIDLLTSPPFRFNTWIGERADVVLNTNMQFPMRFATGESIQIRFYEPGFNVATGETMICELETKSDYYAEFVTEGCLNNDYQDIDPESGQPLPQEYNGTSVEGEMFSKYIVGRCF